MLIVKYSTNLPYNGFSRKIAVHSEVQYIFVAFSTFFWVLHLLAKPILTSSWEGRELLHRLCPLLYSMGTTLLQPWWRISPLNILINVAGQGGQDYPNTPSTDRKFANSLCDFSPCLESLLQKLQECPAVLVLLVAKTHMRTALNALAGTMQKTTFSSHPVVGDEWDNSNNGITFATVTWTWHESETEAATNVLGTVALNFPSPPFFIMPAETETSPPREDDNISLVSASSVSRGSTAPTLVRQDFPLVIKLKRRVVLGSKQSWSAFFTPPRLRLLLQESLQKADSKHH